ncbi:MAG: alpha/beta hydrolase [Bacteroidales bacterium]|nr:alpha/beta hydrolase [Bacteroidales bacterium]
MSCVVRESDQASGKKKLNEYTLEKDVEWATPEGFSLTMDIYTPDAGKNNYPVFIIYHGGGWLINDKSIMNEMSKYIVEHADYVVCNVNYRLLIDNDNTITMNQIVEDAFGALLWIKENISKYKGDPGRIAVSGDSAGGHLAAMIVNCGNKLSSAGFDSIPLGFNPTYLPEGMTAEEVAEKEGLAVQAAALNYPGTDIYQTCLGNFETNENFFWQFSRTQARGIFGDKINAKDNPEYYKACSPIYTIPSAEERSLPPQLCSVGTEDNLTTPVLITEYAEALKNAGHEVEYWEHEGRPHAYLDSGSNEYLGTSFKKDAPIAIDRIIEFLDKVF